MNHIFIINPIAGKGNYQKQLIENINSELYGSNTKYEIYITKFKGDAKNFVEEKCKENVSYRFYACGGDGTLHEVVNSACKYKHISIGLIPCGSGNDFVRNFSGIRNFLNIENQINGIEEYIDLIRVKDEYAISVCNMGFDADVAFNMHKFKRIPFISGSGCYALSVLYCLMKKLGKNLTVELDGNEIIDENFLLGVVANGHSYGGGYKCAPTAQVNDGEMDLCFIKKVSRFKIIKLMKSYKVGTHLNNKDIMPYIFYRHSRNVKIKSDGPINLCVDGESYVYNDMEFDIVENAVKFNVPQGAKLTNSSQNLSFEN